jgi:hypothetical protein
LRGPIAVVIRQSRHERGSGDARLSRERHDRAPARLIPLNLFFEVWVEQQIDELRIAGVGGGDFL